MTVIRSTTISLEKTFWGKKLPGFIRILLCGTEKTDLEYITCRGGLTNYQALRKEQLDCSRTSFLGER